MNRDLPDSGAEAPPRSAGEIRKQLADLAIVRAAAERHGTPDFASTLGMQSICLHQDALLRELRAAEMLESGADVELVVNGGSAVQFSTSPGDPRPDSNEPAKSPAN
jgi:hypothetical protein